MIFTFSTISGTKKYNSVMKVQQNPIAGEMAQNNFTALQKTGKGMAFPAE
jgi:hypothetical protein